VSGERIEIDGRPATVATLAPALANYGHFTMMQVRGGGVRGLALHLDRLDAASRELYGHGVDGALVRARIRHALAGQRDATVRVQVFGEPGTSMLVAVRPPRDMPPIAQRLASVQFGRFLAHVKSAGTFGQTFHALAAERRGFHDALLVGPGGAVAEAGIANVGFLEDGGVLWPDGPQLHGITMQLLERALGDGSRRATVRLADLSRFAGAFVCNSIGIAPVERIDDVELPVDRARVDALVEAYAATPPDPL